MQVRFALPIEMAEGGNPPTEFRIWKWGKTDTLQGPVVLDAKSASKIIDAFNEHGVDLAIDYEHQTFSAENNGKPAPAAGWFRPEVRDDGLYASKVQWTDEAAGYLKARQYRYFSPTALLDAKSRTPLKLMPMALTNWPATKNITPLIARADNTPETFMDELLEALGAKDAVELVAAAKRLIGFERDVIALSGAKSGAEAMGAITALKAKAEKADALESEMAKLRADQAAAEIKSLLDEATKDGRIAPAKRGEFEQLHAKHGADALRACLSMLPKAAPAAIPPAADAPSASATAGYTAEQLAIFKQLGVQPAAVAKHKAALIGVVNSEEK